MRSRRKGLMGVSRGPPSRMLSARNSIPLIPSYHFLLPPPFSIVSRQSIITRI
ncbi:hypothetical protein X975_02248, partial [Stegodyphus mimosarum]